MFFIFQYRIKTILNIIQCHMLPNDFFRYSNQYGLVIVVNETQILL